LSEQHDINILTASNVKVRLSSRSLEDHLVISQTHDI
jgi:hypothetical protein